MYASPYAAGLLAGLRCPRCNSKRWHRPAQKEACEGCRRLSENYTCMVVAERAMDTSAPGRTSAAEGREEERDG